MCLVPDWPAYPALELRDDGELTDDSITALGLWARGVEAFHEATERCPNVRRATRPVPGP